MLPRVCGRIGWGQQRIEEDAAITATGCGHSIATIASKPARLPTVNNLFPGAQ
jgi:hypothetical protein